MSLTTVLIGFVGGAAASVAAKKAVELWTRNKGAIQAEIVKDINAADSYLESHWNIDLIDDNAGAADKIVSQAIAYVDKYAGSRDFWKLVLGNIMTMNPTKFNSYVEQIKNIDFAGKIKDQVTEELMKIINQTKQGVAVKLVENKALVAKVPIDTAALPKVVDAAVIANKINEPIIPVTKELMTKLIQESQQRQEALLKAH